MKRIGPLALVALSLTAGAAARADEAPRGERSYAVRLADLERRIEELKQQIRARPARTHGHWVAPGSVTIAADPGRPFALVRARVVVDGALLHDGPVDPSAPLVVRFAAPLALEKHDVSVTLVYRGDDALFPYLRGYTWEVRAQQTVAESDSALVVKDAGDPTAPLDERLRAVWSSR
jgi:hypothetical protein